ncbi:peptide-methionine (S)-S-oxide reductase MsrA [Paenalcaligenes niemegkensis]|uniref:peptide-methionine (S)-S-oxide reductase MsrA n=1 Tax=Paenalcaligenes niemegkensis TaxID=2895469 RepID=UPI001EE968B9|nr:peptide-methionine (S)-S-oxide reductase MsrA [Paenalcaligenes niemegkensis]MCQ9615303.1 peptide-methionine (S)-S-oxide reductase MsrA [Paenalcaligenes niemegkensis]
MSKIAVLGGGCFWCVEPVFNQLKGVTQVLPGYAGGKTENPSYEEVCGKATGHIEVVQVRFDPSQISFDDLLMVFFTVHDPTTVDRQGNDIGPQYASAVFCQDEEQREAVQNIIPEVERALGVPVVTQIRGADRFWPAEPEHQNYYELNPTQGYCQFVIRPKVAAFRDRFKALIKK